MTIEKGDISYLPGELREQILEALTPAHQAIIRSYCNMPEVGGVTVKAYYPGGFAAIKISADNGSSTQIQLPENSQLSAILHKRAMS